MMNDFLNSLFNDMDGFYYGEGRNGCAPKTDVMETKSAYTLKMDLPGRTENDVDIQLDRNTLTISSKKTEKIAEKCGSGKEIESKEKAENKCEKNEKSSEDKNAEEEKPRMILYERKMVSFSRSFSLPEDVDYDGISASFKNGVLTVVLPRKKVNEPKRIAINVA